MSAKLAPLRSHIVVCDQRLTLQTGQQAGARLKLTAREVQLVGQMQNLLKPRSLFGLGKIEDQASVDLIVGQRCSP